MKAAGKHSDEVHTAELKSMGRIKREKICANAGVVQKAKLTKVQSLAMKVKLRITWSQMRKQKAILRQFGVQFESEKAEREVKNSLMYDTISKTANLFFKDEDNNLVRKPAPIVQVTSLQSFLIEKLERYEKENKLIWPSYIPKDKIWIKIGGDKGGGSFKACAQIVNVQYPNSPNNTTIFATMEAPDYYDNMDFLLDRYKDEIPLIDGMEWNGYTIELLGGGDILYVNTILEISTCSSTYPCYACEIDKDEMQKPRHGHKAYKRTLRYNGKYYRNFVENGSNLKNQAKYKNVINPAIFNIEPSSYIPPYLHLLLGIIKKHHELFEYLCHVLDQKIAAELAKERSPLQDTPFEVYVEQLKKMNSLPTYIKQLEKEILTTTEDINDEEDATELRGLKSQLARLKKDKSNAEKELKKVEDPSLKIGHGPIAGSLDHILKRKKICRQAYHGKSFVGNHCNKYLKDDVLNELCNSVPQEVKSIVPHCPDLIAEAESISQLFLQLNRRFRKIHTAVSHSKQIEEANLGNIKTHIDNYMRYYRRKFPEERVTVKQHILEHHVIPCLQKYKVGFGVLGESGFESIHARINGIKWSMVGIKNPEQRLLSTIKEHHLGVAPSLQSLLPHNRRKRKHADI